MVLEQSKEMSHEYCCSLVKIGPVIPIEGSDFLGKTLVDGFSVVVRKDITHEGDIMFYASNESEICEEFLSINNEFDLSNAEKNSNYKEVQKKQEEIRKVQDDLNTTNKLLSEVDADKSNAIEILNSKKAELENKIEVLNNELGIMHGYFSKYGRVRMINLRKTPSYGFLFSIEMMERYCPEIKHIDLEEFLNREDRDFDTVNGKLFVKAYVPRVHKNTGTPQKCASKKEKESRIIPGEFIFHYDTQQLNKNLGRFDLYTDVSISVKIHGTSVCLEKVRVKSPKKFKSKAFTWFYNHIIPKFLRRYDIVYDNIYSSRTVIKNDNLNEVKPGFYGTDIWGEYNELLKNYIEDGMAVYGEIFGYLTDSDSMIQKDYDYGCAKGTNRMMPYRITQMQEDGTRKEFSVVEVKAWTDSLIYDHPELRDKLISLPILYIGTFRDKYKDATSMEEVLELMKKDVWLGMERNEPLCVNKVPREGIVIRINDDTVPEAFKLKTDKFLSRESKLVDNGEADMEMIEGYGDK